METLCLRFRQAFNFIASVFVISMTQFICTVLSIMINHDFLCIVYKPRYAASAYSFGVIIDEVYNFVM